MKLINYFTSFLKNEVNLDDARLARLHDSVGAISRFLESSPTFSAYFLGTIPQGSYAHKTIIKPVQDYDEFDGDILLHLQEITGWTPARYVEELYSCFRSSGVYRDKVGRKKRCVTIDYAGDFHVDVVPYLERHGGMYVTNRETDTFELTDPEGYNAWLDEKDRITGRHLVKVIRLVKYLRNYKRTFSVKSVVLNVLLAEHVDEAALLVDPGCYSDIPSTLREVFGRLKTYVEAREQLPSIMDPSGTGENLSERWSQEGYAVFRGAVIRYAQWIEDAWAETDAQESLNKWQRIFGDTFKAPKQVASSSLVTSASSLPVKFRQTEQYLVDIGITTAINPRYHFRVSGRVLKQITMGAYYLKNRGNKVQRGRRIQFEVAECNVPAPFEVYWKVTNRGPQAIEHDCVRGQLVRGTRSWQNIEPTAFIGPHFVEAYAVKDGICVAKDRQQVNIV